MGLETRPLRFVRAGRIVEIDSVSPNRTLLQWLRDPAPGGAGCTGTKEGCAEGDCGACTVVLGELERGEAEHAQRLRYRAVNACIRPLASIEGTVLWTVEDLSGPSDRLHPAQQAMLQSHASQCGFCTPGFVMTLFAAYHERRSKGLGPVSRAQAQKILAGNLCRCTGYRPIVEAAQTMF